jgi:hypothetical protein
MKLTEKFVIWFTRENTPKQQDEMRQGCTWLVCLFYIFVFILGCFACALMIDIIPK